MMSPKDPLSARQRRILALVIHDHVETAQPVASSGLVQRHNLPYSSATVRNDLGVLESLGLLVQPHTSAGRVPAVAGYRYFVEHLVRHAELPEAERDTIRHQFHQAGWDLERWLKLSAAVLARISGVAAVVAAERWRPAPLRRVDLIRLDDGLIQLVGILSNGTVRQLRWKSESALDQSQLNLVAASINAGLAENLDLGALQGAHGADTEILDAVGQLWRTASRPAASQLYHAGLTQVLNQPEFAEGGRMREVVELLEYGQVLEPLLQGMPVRGVQVLIGGEPPLEHLPYMALVLAPFGEPSPLGILGVVGPTRLPYQRAVPSVGFMAGLMTRLMAGSPA